jgi:hypothetical protein
MIRESLIRCLLAVCIAGLLIGCAAGQKYDYGTVVGDLSASGNKAIGVATHDQRPDIVSGAKDPDYVGTLRGGFYNPFNVNTKSGHPLSDDMTQAIASSLSKKGFKVIAVVTLPKDSPENILEKLKATRGENLILLTLHDWKSDVFASGPPRYIRYNATLKVLDKNGKTLADAKITGEDDLGSAIFSYENAVREAFKMKIERLLNNPEVVQSLQQ